MASRAAAVEAGPSREINSDSSPLNVGGFIWPPFLLDDHVPRYQSLSSRGAARKHFRNCNLCPQICGVNRYRTAGMCLIGDKAKVNVMTPHLGQGVRELARRIHDQQAC